jgi:hypothetical protein
MTFRACESGVALRFPPQSMTRIGLPMIFEMTYSFALSCQKMNFSLAAWAS